MDKKNIRVGFALKMENGYVSLIDHPHKNQYVVGSPSIDLGKYCRQFIGKATSPNYQQVPTGCVMPKLGDCKHKFMEEIRVGTNQKYSMGAFANETMTINIPKSRMTRPLKNSENALGQYINLICDVSNYTVFKNNLFGEKKMFKLVFHYINGQTYTARQVSEHAFGKNSFEYSKTIKKGGVTTQSHYRVDLSDIGVIEIVDGAINKIWKNPVYQKKFSIKVEKSVLKKTPKTSQKESKVNPRKRKTELVNPVTNKAKIVRKKKV